MNRKVGKNCKTGLTLEQHSDRLDLDVESRLSIAKETPSKNLSLQSEANLVEKRRKAQKNRKNKEKEQKNRKSIKVKILIFAIKLILKGLFRTLSPSPSL